MKKFVKMSAVLAALVLALGCFTACSNDSIGGGNNGGSGTGNYSNTSETTVLEGLWLDYGKGYYVKGNKVTVTEEGDEEDSWTCTFKVDGNTLTLTYDDGEVETYTKVNKTPTPKTYSD